MTNSPTLFQLYLLDFLCNTLYDTTYMQHMQIMRSGYENSVYLVNHVIYGFPPGFTDYVPKIRQQ